MSNIKVMISGFYRGGAWVDKDTGRVFDPRKDAGQVFSFSATSKLDSIMESIAKNHLVPFDSISANYFKRVTRNELVVTPQVVDVRGKQMQLQIVFDRPVYPIPGKQVHVTTRQGVVSLNATDAFMEGYATAVYTVNATGPVKIDAGAFIDDEKVLTEAYPVEVKAETKAKAETKSEPVVPVETPEEAPKKKAPVKKTRKKAESAE